MFSVSLFASLFKNLFLYAVIVCSSPSYLTVNYVLAVSIFLRYYTFFPSICCKFTNIVSFKNVTFRNVTSVILLKHYFLAFFVCVIPFIMKKISPVFKTHAREHEVYVKCDKRTLSLLFNIIQLFTRALKILQQNFFKTD